MVSCEPAHFSLIFVLDDIRQQVLLGMKRRGFGAGLYNGFGGKPKIGEAMDACARRELQEECGIIADEDQLVPAGRIDIVRETSVTGGFTVIHIHVYTVRAWTGDIQETDEMSPLWVPLSRLDDKGEAIFEHMWPEARLYMPHLLRYGEKQGERKIKAYLEYHFRSSHDIPGWQTLKHKPDVSRVETLCGWDISIY